MVALGQPPPDSRLHQGRLAESLGVSRRSIREALLRLESEGLVYTVPGRGMFVRGLTPTDISEVYQTREALEPVAVRLACERATAQDVARLHAIQGQHERAYPEDVAAVFRSNYDLHMALARPCGNELLLKFLTTIWTHVSALRTFAIYSMDAARVRGMVEEHRAIVAAYAAGDPSAVEQLMAVHIRAAHRKSLAGLAQTHGLEDTGSHARTVRSDPGRARAGRAAPRDVGDGDGSPGGPDSTGFAPHGLQGSDGRVTPGTNQ
jgi:DNA-binding GntR family transcriptional regulator